MSSSLRRILSALLALAAAAPLAAQSAAYDFESLTPGPLTSPACLTNNGIGACFTADEVWPGAQDPEPPGFSGRRLHSVFDVSGPAPARISIQFDRALDRISFPFEFRPFGDQPPLAISLAAFRSGTPVGTCVVPSTIELEREQFPGGALDVVGEAGLLQCDPGRFDSVVISGDPRQGNIFIDNVAVAAVPEPGAALLLATGLLLAGGVARRRAGR